MTSEHRSAGSTERLQDADPGDLIDRLVSERKHSRQQAEEASTRLRKLAANVPGVLYQFRLWPDGRFSMPFASGGLVDIYGIMPAEVVNDATPVFHTVHPDDLEQVRQSIACSARDLSRWRNAHRAILPSGETIWLEGEAQPERLPDGGVLWHGYIRNVTEQKLINDRVQASEAMHRAMFNNVNDCIMLHRILPDGRPGPFEEVNDVACRLLGYTREELLRLRASEIDLPEALPDINAIMLSLRQTGHATFETVLLTRDGQQIEAEVSAHQFEMSGQPRILSVVRDIRERKAAERELRQALEMQQAIVGASPMAMMTVSPDGRVLSWNSAAERVFGWEAAAVINQPVPFIPPGKDDEFDDIRRRLMEGEVIESLHLTRMRRNGSLIRVALSAAPVRDADGQVVAIMSMMADITEIFSAQEALRQHAQVFESSREGIVITDRDNRILSVNAAYTQITGYSADEVVGRNPSVAASGDVSVDVFRGMWDKLEREGHWQGELINKRKDGSVYPQWLSINTVRGADGQPSYYIGWLRDLTSEKEIEQRLERLSNLDSLTGLPNRSLFRDRLEVQVVAAGKRKASFCLLYLDLDRFKIVNDSMGTESGDVYLQKMAERLSSLLRPTDTVSRLGGDEFALLLTDTDAEGAAHVANKVQTELARPLQIADQQLTLTVSIGIAVYPDDGADFQSLLTAADVAVNRAKEKGRNTYEFFTIELQEKARRTLQIETDLRSAVRSSALSLHYQPKVELATGRIVGAEALLRWQHPEYGPMSPAVFIPVAEETDLIIEIGNWVLGTALQQQAAWREQGLPLVPVAVNLSVREFRQFDIVVRVERQLAAQGVDPSLLELEITEGVALDGSSRVVEVMQHLRALGVAIAIDDFGTGYSSLSYLKRFNINDLKIDQSFVRVLDADNQAIVTAIMGVAEGLGLTTTAEGIETAEQLAFLMSQGCCFGQGYYFSRPMPAADFARLLAEGRDYRGLIPGLAG